jgi:hypothetical protein
MRDFFYILLIYVHDVPMCTGYVKNIILLVFQTPCCPNTLLPCCALVSCCSRLPVAGALAHIGLPEQTAENTLPSTLLH